MNWEWQEGELRETWKKSLITASNTHDISIFLDGLDEVGDEPADSVISFVHHVAEQIQSSKNKLRICLSCRHYPLIRTNEGLRICMEEENRHDIDRYIDAELNRKIILFDDEAGHAEIATLQHSISSKASGVFLWAVLAIPVIAEQYQGGKPLDAIIDAIGRGPEDLYDMYKDILTTQDVDDQARREQRLHLMEWICCSNVPLTVVELRYALASHDSMETSRYQFSASDSAEFVESDSRMAAIITALSGGLAEVRLYEDSIGTHRIVQVIHQSVKDFFVQEGLHFLHDGLVVCYQGDPVAVAHDRLCKSCLNYLMFEEIQSIQRLDGLDDYPFLEYALGNWFLHAQEAEDGGIDQSSIIKRFRWPRPRCFEKWYGLFEEVCGCDEYVSLSSGLGLLHISAMSNLVSVVRGLLRYGDNVNATDDDGNTPLHYAASQGREEIFSILLSKGAHVDAKNEFESTPLEEAVWIGNYHAVQLLLSMNVNMDLVNPLIKAAYSGDLRIVELLLDHGADYNSQGRLFKSALEAALRGGKMEVISLFCGKRGRNRYLGLHRRQSFTSRNIPRG